MQTITTLEISTTLNKRHYDVMRVVRRLLNKGCNIYVEKSTFKIRNQSYEMFILDKVAGENIIELLISHNKYINMYREYMNPEITGFTDAIQETKSQSNIKQPIEELGSLSWWLTQVRALNSKPAPHLSRITKQQAFKLTLDKLNASKKYELS